MILTQRNREERSDCDEARVRRQGRPEGEPVEARRRRGSRRGARVDHRHAEGTAARSTSPASGSSRRSTARSARASTRATRAEKVTIPATTVPKFSAGSTLKAVRRRGATARRRQAAAAGSRPRASEGLREGRASGPPSFRRPSGALASALEARAEPAVATALFPDRLAEAVERKRSPARRRPRSAARPAAGRAARRRAPLAARPRPRRAAASAAGSSTRSRRTSSPSSRSSRSSRRSAPTACAPFEEVCAYARSAGLLVIADGKRGDIGSTARAYAAAYLEPRGEGPPLADALTVNPYLGRDSLEPFLAACRRDGAGIFCLVKTSNEGGADVQDLVALGRAAALAARRAARARAGRGARRRARPLERRRRRRRDAPARRRRGAPAAAAGDPAPAGRRRAGRDARRPRPRVHERPGERARQRVALASSTPSATVRRTGEPRQPCRGGAAAPRGLGRLGLVGLGAGLAAGAEAVRRAGRVPARGHDRRPARALRPADERLARARPPSRPPTRRRPRRPGPGRRPSSGSSSTGCAPARRSATWRSSFDTTVEQLLALNPGIEPTNLTVGQRVRVK